MAIIQRSEYSMTGYTMSYQKFLEKLMMHISTEQGNLVLELSQAESDRLAVALAAGVGDAQEPGQNDA
ncbi:hypothetical protein [Microbacterium immunditiarum]|uniref:Uncharacterized protein n=1 Tax=Microbacterium immunditiarum TaxID=337480 RepID=A0A7Y9GRZ8_9MICO|nr:hypothetical protein [Microbacterium immunditiarum]NYE21602.1 hypothetical protein [Microbacterium immunditiarum]